MSRNKENLWGQRLCLALYLILGIPMFYFYEADITVGGFGVMYCYIFGIAIIILGFLVFLAVPNVERFLVLAGYSLILMLPYLFSLLYSFVIWVVKLEEFRIMTRGFFYPAYQMIGILTAASTMYIFGKKGIYCLVVCALFASLLEIGQIAAQTGLGSFAGEYIRLLTSFAADTGPAMRRIEMTGCSFALGLFLIYFAVARKECGRYLLLVIPCGVIFLMGMKRITIPGVFTAVGLALVLQRVRREKTQNTLLFAGGCILCLTAFYYVWLIRNNIFAWVMGLFGINTMGRVEFYKIINDFYEFSPLYFGKGLGYISRMIQSGRIDLGYAQAGELHNDFLRQYIEIGFPGYLVWLWLMFGTRVRRFAGSGGARHGILVFACVIYCFFTYLTDNTYYYFYTNTAFAAVVMCYHLDEAERKLQKE